MGFLSEEDVQSYLKEVQELATSGKNLLICDSNPKNRQCQLTSWDKLNFLRECLTYENYIKGPEADIDFPDDRDMDLYFFGFIDPDTCIEYYLKLRIETGAIGNRYIYCQSYHEAEYPQIYRYKKK